MKKVIISIAFLLTTVAASAQNEEKATGKHEYSVYLTGGMSSLVYKLNKDGETSGGFGGGAGFAYTYNLSQNFGISAGLEFSTFGSKASYKTLSEEYNAIDDNGDDVQYNYSLKNYEESQSLALFSIPIMARYKTSGNIQFYAAGGFKLGFPVSDKATIQPGEVTASGYYEYEQRPYHDLLQHGFPSNHKPGEQTSNIETGFAAILSLESGLRFNLGKNALYAGVYFDYALNDLKQAKDKHPLTYNRTITYESVLNSALADKLNLMSVGLKVKFRLF